MIWRFDPDKMVMSRYVMANVMVLFSKTKQCWTELDKLSDLWQLIARQVLERDNYRCVECKTNRGINVYHVVPIKSGGSNMMPNLRTYCHRCQRTKAQAKRDYVFKANTERTW